MAKKLKLKKNIKKILIIILLLIVCIYSSIKIYKNYKYKQTYEYKLINHGYTKKESQILLKNVYNQADVKFFLNHEINNKYIDITKEEYFIKRNYFDYINYLDENPNYLLKDIVRNINTHINYDYYSMDFKTNTSKDYLMLVNKYYLLDKTYIPNDLVYISQKYAWGEKNSKQIRKIAYDAFVEMWNDAKNNQDFQFMINSSYRSYNDQNDTYNLFKNKKGITYADKIAARPGASEHQTGLAIDIFSIKNSTKKDFENSPEANWLCNNAYKYGFILRYPKGKENITGYSYEPWHYRYIGKKAASYCFKNDLTFDEYYAYFVESKKKD